VGDWIDCYRIAHRSDRIRARIADGGESYGHPDMKLVAKPGQWLCENPANNYRWVCDQKSFDLLYCAVGSLPVARKKRQEDGHRKGQSRLRSVSYQGDNSRGLFHEEKEESGEQDKGNVV